MEQLASFPIWALLPIVGAVAFVQNMAFTWVNRSRNSGDVAYHRRAAYASNGIWFVTQLLIQGAVWSSITTGSLWKIALVGAVYVVATSEGSCTMMAKLLKTERGKQQVGAR